LIGQVLLVLILIVIFAVLLLRELASRPHPVRSIRQSAQFAAMAAALELHANEFDAYPPSEANDPMGVPYCGAMRLCEGVMGQDLLGLHSESVFREDGFDGDGKADLYPDDFDVLEDAHRDKNLVARRGPYLQAENANAYRLADIYGEGRTGPFDPNVFVLCDTFFKSRLGSVKIGMPILYYRADPNGTAHDADDPNNPNNIYNYRDNQALLTLGVPGEPNGVHPLSDPKRFYMNTQNTKIRGRSVPHNADAFILLSAGYDGLYGTADDICNFAWKYRE
jgi:hypothetical protein